MRRLGGRITAGGLKGQGMSNRTRPKAQEDSRGGKGPRQKELQPAARPEAERPAAERPAGPSAPLVLTGGLLHPLRERRVDWLTASVPTPVARELGRLTTMVEIGRGVIGFHSSDRRECPGGKVWRRFDPAQEHKDWGKQYESWEFQGESAPWGAQVMRGLEGRPSRVDLAWDFACDEKRTPDEVSAVLGPHAESVGLTLGIAGQGGRNTRYIGAVKSMRRIRIYRKDWEDERYARMVGPTMRVELVLKADAARMWWPIWQADERRAWASGVGHVYEMTGHLVEQEIGDVPKIAIDAVVAERIKLQRFLRQYSSTLAAYHRAGVRILELAEKQERESTCRMRRSRLNRRVEEMQRAGLAECVEVEFLEVLDDDYDEYLRDHHEQWATRINDAAAKRHPRHCFCADCRGGVWRSFVGSVVGCRW